MKMNAGMWIGLGGGLLGIIVGMSAVLNTAGPAGIYVAGGMLLFFGGMFFLFYKLFFKQMFLAARLKKTGIPGKALIKEVHDTGVTINNSPQVKLIVEVKNYLGQSYTTTMRVLVSRINPGMYRPGMLVQVLIDPKDENQMVIDNDGDTQGRVVQQKTATTLNTGVYDTGPLEAELAALMKKDDEIRLTGTAARAIIKTYNWLGVNVNGNNPYAELELEVLPADAPAFQAKIKGVVAAQSIAKFQPGREIYVKYDPRDTARVAMDHS